MRAVRSLFSTAVAEMTHIQKHYESTRKQTEPERSRRHLQRAKHRPASRPHPDRHRPQYSERSSPHWRPARGSDRATPVPTVATVAVKTEAAVLKLRDDYELNWPQLQYHIDPFQGHQSILASYGSQ